MATTHANYTLSSSQQTLVSPYGVHSGTDITIQNLSSSAYVYIGGDGVNGESFGYRIDPGTAFSVELSSKSPLYAIASADSTLIAVLNTSLEVGA